MNPEWLPIYRALAADGRLTARVVAAQQWQRWAREREADPLPRLIDGETIPGYGQPSAVVKFFLDGVFESETAYLLEPYLTADGEPGTDRSTAEYQADELIGAVTELERLGFDCHFHAIGDAAVRQALDAVAAARAANGPRDTRHSIAHIELSTRATSPLRGTPGVAANMQPFWAYANDETRAIQLPLIGPERFEARYAFGDQLPPGARLAIGSDWTVTTADPLQILEVAVRRVVLTQRDDPPWRPDQRLDLDTALAAATIGSAWSPAGDRYRHHRNRQAGRPGRPRPGPPRRPGDQTADARVRLTLVEGAVVYDEPTDLIRVLAAAMAMRTAPRGTG